MATICGLARSVGVSAKTVSRVLSGDAPVGKATREVVEAAWWKRPLRWLMPFSATGLQA